MDPFDPERESMTDDLLKNYKIIGSSQQEIIQLLGEPAFEDSTGIFYTLQQNMILLIRFPEKTSYLKLIKIL